MLWHQVTFCNFPFSSIQFALICDFSLLDFNIYFSMRKSELEPVEFSGINIIYLVAVGLQVFVLLFLLAKRQIQRYTWGPKKNPYTPVGTGLCEVI